MRLVEKHASFQFAVHERSNLPTKCTNHFIPLQERSTSRVPTAVRRSEKQARERAPRRAKSWGVAKCVLGLKATRGMCNAVKLRNSPDNCPELCRAPFTWASANLAVSTSRCPRACPVSGKNAIGDTMANAVEEMGSTLRRKGTGGTVSCSYHSL